MSVDCTAMHVRSLKIKDIGVCGKGQLPGVRLICWSVGTTKSQSIHIAYACGLGTQPD